MTGFLDTLALALGTLRANPLRSLLTLLGIVIGAATVVAMMSLTEGLRLKVTTDLAQLGAASFQVQKFPAVSFGDHDRAKYAKRKDLTREQGEAIRALCPHVAHVSIEEYHQGTAERIWTAERATRPNVGVAGVVPDYEYANAVTVAEGRFVSQTDIALGRRVAVVGTDVSDLLFPGESAVGREIRIRGASFEVVGVFERMGSVLGLESRDAIVTIPWPAFEQVLGKANNDNIAIQATSNEDVPRAIDEVVGQLRRLRGLAPDAENDFEIFSNDSIAEVFNNIAAVVTAATFGVCALALLVGGIGIMNIMLVSVAERTREIGVRMALGARRRRILSQFVVESVTLSLLGGLLGVLLGAGIALGARTLYQVPASVPAWAVLLSLVSASGCGLLFGIYPAARASRLDPVEAMRTE
ncbi:ABC transporter permease [Anaeromyxobacter paludicola]|uniref:ABC transporter n=1 Tax=Anaeromyxobacter paludicola TaxID=2918171 RepID=A0ABM7XDK9_9BACT|nr:ABC transporter permease [Anaeromyxobacter paludicola]BDG09933.1 ABC transporter [Anaeromyxobacter paludicola]